MAQRDDYQQHIHVFRGLAIIAIVCAHTLPSLNWTANPNLGRALDAVVNQSSIFFFFIAGYLFEHLSDRFSYKRYLLQKLKTVLLPYLIFSIPALVVFTMLTQRVGMWSGFYDLPVAAQVALFLITGKHLAPLWFVPTITLFYLAAPLFLYIDRRCPAAYWIVVPLLLLSTWVNRGGQYGPLNFALYLLPVYLLGMAFSRFKAAAITLIRKWWILLAALAVLSFIGEVYQWGSPPWRQMPLKAAMALLLTAWLYGHHQWFGSRLNYIAEVSFGIFFIHAYFISAIKVVTVYLITGQIYKGEGAEIIPGTALNFTVYAASVLFLTVTFIWLMKKLLGRSSRMVIGA